jgi:5-hydroxyisourate hydrolase-like protein (transthyretin family)
LTIDFQVTTYLEDVLVNIPANVTIRNNQSNELLKSINVYTTNYFNLTFENASSIPKMLSVETTTNNSLFRGGIAYYPVYYREQTVIGTNYHESIIVERLQNLQLQIQVNKTKTNQSVIEGLVELIVDSNKISQINLQVGNAIGYLVPIDTVVGLHELKLEFLGTDSLRPSSVTYDLVVYSNVHFSYVTVNNTFTNPNTPILIEGYVVDENKTPILTKISIIDNSDEVIDQTTTDTNGKFSFIIINTDVLGYYNYKLRAETVNYYKTAEYQFNLLQNNDFTVIITANETMKSATITIKGDIQGIYELRYFTDITKDYPIKLLNLDEKGEIETAFLTPNVIGPIYFNITNMKDSSQTWIKKIILYKTPTVSISQESDAYVGEKLNITINSDVYYRLFFNDKLLSNQYFYINKTTLSLDMETKGINNLKLVFQSEYITLDEKLYEIFVFEKVILKQNLPEKINENTNITTYLQIVNNNDIPLGNVEVEFLHHEQALFHKKTDNKGELIAVISINDLLEKYSFKIVGNQDQYIKEQVFPINSVLIRSLKLVSNIEEKYFSDLTKTQVKFKVMFKNTDEPAPKVNMSIEILDEGQKKDIYHLTTDGNGELVLDIKKSARKYILTVITEDPNYIMSKSVYEFTVEKFDVVDNPFFVPTLFMSGAGILVSLRKKIIK